MLSQDVRDLVANFKKIWVGSEALRKQNMDLPSGVRKKRILAIINSGRLKA